MQSKNFAARAGRWSAQHRKQAILGWFAFVILATVIGGAVGMKTLADEDMGNGESQRVDRIDAAAGFPDQTGETVLVQGRGGVRVGDPQLTAGVRDVIAKLQTTSGVRKIKDPFAPENKGNISKDGRSVLVDFELPGDIDAAKQAVAAPLAAVARLQRAHPGLRVEEFGDASSEKGLSKALDSDFQKAEVLSLPITLLILLVAFGALVAAGLPLLLGATAVMGAIGLLGPVSQLHGLSDQVSSVVLLVGLAVGVDYCMFYLRREMEERDAGRSPDAALEAAAATSGRAVLISGFTVMAAMAGMFLAGNAVFVSFGIGTVLVVAVAVLGSLTVLPAMLSFLSQKGWTEKGRVPWVGKRRHRNQGESRVWGAIVDRVLRHPGVSVVLAGGLLLALSIPAFSMHTINPGIAGLPRNIPVMQTYDRIQAAFPGGSVPAVTVVKAKDVTTPEVQSAIVLSLAFILLLVTFRSIVIPITAIVLNLLSVGAAYGVLKLVLQDGHREKLLGFHSLGGVTAWLPLFLFVILFGLSMDYHVFILSRIREAYDRGESTSAAISHGIKSTAGVVTSAAMVMVAVFSIFATLSLMEFKQMGVGLAVAILVDATIVRAVLVPAGMKLLDDRNWYLPKGLHWLPKLDHEPQAEPARA